MLTAEPAVESGAAVRPLLCLLAAAVVGGLGLRLTSAFATAGFLSSVLTLVIGTLAIGTTAVAVGVALGVWSPRPFLTRVAGWLARGA